MQTISQPYRGNKRKVKKSRFIASIYPVLSRKDVENRLEEIGQEFKKATHNAYAYRIYIKDKDTNQADCSDDGEVKGTAGEPLLNLLGRHDLTNVLVVVTRFYGGINLGPGGLLREYSGTAHELLSNIPTIEFIKPV